MFITTRLLPSVLQKYIDCRSGDFIRSSFYKGMQCLIWQDVEMISVGIDPLENIQATVTIPLMRKEPRTIPRTITESDWISFKRIRASYTTPSSCISPCPSTRSGCRSCHDTRSTSNVSQSIDRGIVWTQPTWSVLPAFRGNGKLA